MGAQHRRYCVDDWGSFNLCLIIATIAAPLLQRVWSLEHGVKRSISWAMRSSSILRLEQVADIAQGAPECVEVRAALRRCALILAKACSIGFSMDVRGQERNPGAFA